MTNPNCEYSLNIPAMVTLADWANNKKWDVTGQQSHKLAVKEFLQETAVASYAADTAVQTKSQICPEDQLKEGDVDLLFQMFWLPHSHGPKIQELLDLCIKAVEGDFIATFIVNGQFTGSSLVYSLN